MQGLLDMSQYWNKRLHLPKIILFTVFSGFGWARDIWPMIDYLAVVREFLSGLLPPSVVDGGIIDH